MSKKRNKERYQMGSESEELKDVTTEDIVSEDTPETPEKVETAQAPEIKTESEVIDVAKSEEPAKSAESFTLPTAKENPTKDVIAPKSVSIQQMQSDNARVRQFAFQCNQYISLHKNGSVSEADLTKKLSQFANIIRSIINSTDTAVYDAAYKFFKEHRNDILSEEFVFQYIHKLPTELSIRVQTVYTSFRELVAANLEHRKFRLDYGLIRDNMKLPSTHPLLNWIRKRLNSK